MINRSFLGMNALALALTGCAWSGVDDREELSEGSRASEVASALESGAPEAELRLRPLGYRHVVGAGPDGAIANSNARWPIDQLKVCGQRLGLGSDPDVLDDLLSIEILAGPACGEPVPRSSIDPSDPDTHVVVCHDYTNQSVGPDGAAICRLNVAPTAIIRLGYEDVMSGGIREVTKRKPRPGEKAQMNLWLGELAWFMNERAPGHRYTLPITPHVYVRYNDYQAFEELEGLPSGIYSMAGPRVDFPAPVAPVELAIPAGATRIEVYLRFERVVTDGDRCYSSYGLACPVYMPTSDGYVSNYGQNFRLELTL